MTWLQLGAAAEGVELVATGLDVLPGVAGELLQVILVYRPRAWRRSRANMRRRASLWLVMEPLSQSGRSSFALAPVVLQRLDDEHLRVGRAVNGLDLELVVAGRRVSSTADWRCPRRWLGSGSRCGPAGRRVGAGY